MPSGSRTPPSCPTPTLWAGSPGVLVTCFFLPCLLAAVKQKRKMEALRRPSAFRKRESEIVETEREALSWNQASQQKPAKSCSSALWLLRSLVSSEPKWEGAQKVQTLLSLVAWLRKHPVACQTHDKVHKRSHPSWLPVSQSQANTLACAEPLKNSSLDS